jgi:uncharacterized LabA/DUF88 family protein
MTRVGVFYDGGWFAVVSDYYAHHHRWRASISLPGLHDALRWWLGQTTDEALSSVEIVQAHYVRGRSQTPSRTFDRVLQECGVTRHDVALSAHGEKGADVYLALEAYERALETSLDVVALISGDGDFVPLVER